MDYRDARFCVGVEKRLPVNLMRRFGQLLNSMPTRLVESKAHRSPRPE